MSFSFENDLSVVALVTGQVREILRRINKFGNTDWRLKWQNKANRFGMLPLLIDFSADLSSTDSESSLNSWSSVSG